MAPEKQDFPPESGNVDTYDNGILPCRLFLFLQCAVINKCCGTLHLGRDQKVLVIIAGKMMYRDGTRNGNHDDRRKQLGEGEMSDCLSLDAEGRRVRLK